MPSVDYRKLNRIFRQRVDTHSEVLARLTKNIIATGVETEEKQTPPYAVLLHPTKHFAVGYRYSAKTLQRLLATAPNYEKIPPCYEVQFLAFQDAQTYDLTPLMEFPQGLSPKELPESDFLAQAQALFEVEGVSLKSTATPLAPDNPYAIILQEELSALSEPSPSLEELNVVFCNFINEVYKRINPDSKSQDTWAFSPAESAQSKPSGMVSLNNGLLMAISPSDANMDKLHEGGTDITHFHIQLTHLRDENLYDVTSSILNSAIDPKNISNTNILPIIKSLTSFSPAHLQQLDLSGATPIDTTTPTGAALYKYSQELAKLCPSSAAMGKLKKLPADYTLSLEKIIFQMCPPSLAPADIRWGGQN